MPIIFWPTGQGAGPSSGADYPNVGDVRDGISYGSGSYTGTLELPAVGDVRIAIGYGENGTEFTGTLAFLLDSVNPPLVSLLNSLNAIVAQIPDKVDVAYYPRLVTAGSVGDSYDAPVTFEARRQPLTSYQIDGLGTRQARWQLYSTEGQATKPKAKGKIVVGGITYHVEQVTSRWNDPTYGTLIHDCDCVQAVS